MVQFLKYMRILNQYQSPQNSSIKVKKCRKRLESQYKTLSLLRKYRVLIK